MKPGPRHLLATLMAATLLSGCSAALLNTGAYDIFTSKEVNLAEKNNAAADYLIGRASHFVSNTDLIRATPLSEIGETHQAPKIARLIPEQVGIRLADLGYRVDLSEVSAASGPNYRKPALSADEQPDYFLGGAYRRRRIEMDVSLRLMDAQNGRVVGVFDYILPLNRETEEMATPDVEIYRTSPQQ